MDAEQLGFMRLAVKTAEQARGICSPNPFVGAVIVKDGKVLSTGWTQACGQDHAEVQALKKAGAAAAGAELYVTLEPCSHHGKTPPCVDAIIAAGIRKVFFGITDPNPLVSGKGRQRLVEAGIEVESGLCAETISRQLEYFLCRILKQRPFVIWKAALSLDGKYAAEDGSSRWISGERSRRETHRFRREADVVLTGIGTVLADDPLLNVRLRNTYRQPLRAVLDSALRLPLSSQLAQTADKIPTLVFCKQGVETTPEAANLRAAGIEVIPVAGEQGRLDLKKVLDVLHQRGYYSILLECGSELASAFLEAQLVDKVFLFYGSKIVGGSRSILSELKLGDISQAIEFRDLRCRKVGGDALIIAYPEYR